MNRVTMLLSNAFRPDPRVSREARTLARAGYQLTVVSWDREGEHPHRESRGGYGVVRIQSVKTSYGAGTRQILHTPRFWRAAAEHALTLDPDIIHCHDLDTLPAGWWLKKRTGAKLVYDAHENYPAMMSLYLPRTLVGMLSLLERRLLHRVDQIITASTVFADQLRARGFGSVVTIGNYQPLAPFDAVRHTHLKTVRDELGLPANQLVVAYIGGFSRNRQLLPLIEAARELPEVEFLLWGDGHQRTAVEQAVNKACNARYLGWLPADQVPLCTSMADVVYYCLLPDYPGAIYNAPNTLSNALAAGRPIIANDVGDLGRIVRETGCGLLLKEVTPLTVQRAVERLRDPAVRREMGAAGRAAAESRYNWAVAGRQLEQLYGSLAEGD